MFKFMCRHNDVSIIRAHPQSLYAFENRNRWAFLDTKYCYNYIVCAKCDKVLNYKKTETIFGENNV